MSFLGDIATKTKEKALEVIAIQLFNNSRINKLGTMTSINLDSKKQELSIVLDLHGEQSPIEVTAKYRVLTPTQIEITEFQSSRAWITTLVNEIVPQSNKQITVPETVTKGLSNLLG
jgi:hypothetical protein